MQAGEAGVRRRRLTLSLSPLLSYRILGRPSFPIPLCLSMAASVDVRFFEFVKKHDITIISEGLFS